MTIIVSSAAATSTASTVIIIAVAASSSLEIGTGGGKVLSVLHTTHTIHAVHTYASSADICAVRTIFSPPFQNISTLRTHVAAAAVACPSIRGCDPDIRRRRSASGISNVPQ